MNKLNHRESLLLIGIIIIGFSLVLSVYNVNQIALKNAKLHDWVEKLSNKINDYEKKYGDINEPKPVSIKLNTMLSDGTPIYEIDEVIMMIFKEYGTGERVVLGHVYPHEIASVYVDTPLFFEINLKSDNYTILDNGIESNVKIEKFFVDDYIMDGKESQIIKIEKYSDLYEIQVYMEKKN